MTSPALATPASGATTSSPDRRTSHRNRAIVLDVPPAVFRGVWVAILTVRCVCMAYLGGISSVYFFLSNPAMGYYTSLLGPKSSQQLFPMAICSAILAVAHMRKAATMLLCSWRRRALVFEAVLDRRVRPIETMLESAQGGARIKDDDQFKCRRLLKFFRELVTTATRIWQKLFGWNGFFSVKSDFFDIRLLSREFAEILAQTLQLMTASQLLVRPSVTHVCAVVVVVNCWSTPVVQMLCQRKLHRMKLNRQLAGSNHSDELRSKIGPRVSTNWDRNVQRVVALERVWCLSIDLVLDMVMCVVVPAVIIVPYLRQFDTSTFDFSMSLLYDDVKFVNLVYEFQHVLAVNPFETMFTLVPHWSIFMCCESLRVLISRDEFNYLAPRRTAEDNQVDPTQSAATTTTVQTAMKSNAELSVGTQRTVKGNGQRAHSVAYRGVVSCIRRAAHSKTSHFVFLVWGVIVLSLYLSALRIAQLNTHDRPIGCKQMLQPWLTRAPACSVVEYNCFMRNTTTPTDEDLRGLHKESLAVLIFSHCEAAIVPRGIQDFPNLLGFEIYNSTILQWDLSAALSVTSQKRLSYIQLLRTNMTNLPAGLVTELPPKLLDIEIRGGNLSSLPNELERRWHPLTVLYVEECGLTSVPDVLMGLQVEYLSLAGNRITRLVLQEEPTSYGWKSSFVSLSLARNPLTELPEWPIGDITSLRFLSLEGTAIDVLPSWVYDAARSGLKVYMRSSQFCTNLAATSMEERFGANAPITCVDEADHNGVPIDIIAEYRPLAS